jgi:thioredoxin type arsenate reductase
VNLGRRATAEAIGTAFLLAAVVGSGIMAERLAGGNVALALLANTLATGAVLVALILTFGPISGAHFNPAVTVSDAAHGGIAWREVPVYILAQVTGALAGVAIAHLMFGLALFSPSHHFRGGVSQVLSEFVAAFGLLCVIWGCARFRSQALPFAVASYITAAYWFTASTSFANPAVTVARSLSDTFAGIRPLDAPAFILAQFAGAITATALFRWLLAPFAADVSIMTEKQKVLILCTGNSARSQMAEGLLRHDAGQQFEVASAGVAPSTVRPEAIEAMREINIDISNHRSKSVEEFMGRQFDYVITVCDNANEQCPVFPGNTKRIHWSFEDPAAARGNYEERLAVFRRVRDEIRQRLQTLMV